MELKKAASIVSDMAKSNLDGVDFNDDGLYSNFLSEECLLLQEKTGGYDSVIFKWTGWRGLTEKQIRIVWKMAGILTANCIIE